jgi:hypothetical protein
MLLGVSVCLYVPLQATPTVDWVALASILVEKSSSQDEFTRITALKWIKVRLLCSITGSSSSKPGHAACQLARVLGRVALWFGCLTCCAKHFPGPDFGCCLCCERLTTGVSAQKTWGTRRECDVS